MRLSVTDMPENFPVQGANGRALSVFARVINLSLDDPAGTQNMVSIDARPDAPLTPGVARLETPAVLDFSRVVRPGARLSVRRGILRIRDADLVLDFRNAATNERGAPAELPGPDVPAAGWTEAWDLILEDAGPAGFAAALHPDGGRSAYARALARRVRNLVPDLLNATATDDLARSRRALRRLLGCGPGLTPSGDDFTTGFLLGLQTRAVTIGQHCLLHGLRAAARSRAVDSSDVSRTYLEQAAAGRYPEPMRRLAAGIAEQADDLRERMANLLRFGHSSGSDAAFGLLCGLTVPDPGLRERVLVRLDSTQCHETFVQ